MQLTVFAVLLLVAAWTGITAGANGPSTSCCQRIKRIVIPVDRIVSYLHQEEGLCPITAVRFTTIVGKTLCSDPESSWAKFVMCVVDKKKITNRAEEICRGTVYWTTPSTTTPANSFTISTESSSTTPTESSMISTPVLATSEETLGAATNAPEENSIEIVTTDKPQVTSYSQKKNFGWVSAEKSLVEDVDGSESPQLPGKNQSAEISKRKNTPRKESAHADEAETLSSAVNGQTPNQYSFCIITGET